MYNCKLLSIGRCGLIYERTQRVERAATISVTFHTWVRKQWKRSFFVWKNFLLQERFNIITLFILLYSKSYIIVYQGSISSTFYVLLLCAQIPEALKDTSDLTDSYAFGSSVRKSCT